MSVIKWNVNYEIGLPVIDVEHRRLIDRFNELVAMKQQGAGEEELTGRIDALLAAVDEHCVSEESVMEREQYSELETHRAHHRDLSERMQKFLHMVGQGRQQIDDTALQFARHWLLNHIIDNDADFGRYLAERAAETTTV